MSAPVVTLAGACAVARGVGLRMGAAVSAAAPALRKRRRVSGRCVGSGMVSLPPGASGGLRAAALLGTLRRRPRCGSGRFRDGDGADLDLAVGVCGQTRDLDGRRGREVAVQVFGPYAVEIVLLVDVGEVARGGDEILHAAAGRLERLAEILHRKDRLLTHGPWEVELLLAVWVAVVHGRGRHTREEEQAAGPARAARQPALPLGCDGRARVPQP